MNTVAIHAAVTGFREFILAEGGSDSSAVSYGGKLDKYLRSGFGYEAWLRSIGSDSSRRQALYMLHKFRAYCEQQQQQIAPYPEPPTRKQRQHKGISAQQREELGYFRDILLGRGYSEQTTTAYCTRVRNFLRWPKREIGGDPQAAHTRSVWRWLSQTKAPHERKLRAAAITKFIHWHRGAYREQSEWYGVKPPNLVKTPERKPPLHITKPQALTVIEYMKRTGTLRDYAMFMVMYGCGLRPQELLDLDVNNVRLDDPTSITVVRSKHGRSRVIPLPSQAAAAVYRYITEQRVHDSSIKSPPLLFLGCKGGAVSRDEVKQWREMVKHGYSVINLPIPTRPLHNWRHVYATGLKEQGIGIEDIRRLLGHRSIETTVAYLRDAPLADLCEKVAGANLLGAERPALEVLAS